MNYSTNTIVHIIANGEMNYNFLPFFSDDDIVIAADGGVNHCQQLKITPKKIIGDLDSASNVSLAAYKNIEIIRHERAKAQTDLEIAIEEAQKVNKFVSIKIWGGLGGRLDHSLFNLYLPIRQPDRVFLETGSESIGALDVSIAPKLFEFSCKSFLTLCAFYGDAQVSCTTDNTDAYRIQLSKKHFLHTLNLRDSSIQLTVLSGKILTVLHDHLEEEHSNVARKLDFTLKNGALSMLKQIDFINSCEDQRAFETDNEVIYRICSLQGKLNGTFQQGTTASILPINGIAQKVQCQGFKWDFQDCNLDEHFMSLSNVTYHKDISVSVTDGVVLLVVNKNLIDTEMLSLPDHSTTGHLSKTLS